MKQSLLFIAFAVIFVSIGWYANVAWNLPKEVSPVAEIKPRPLEKYEIENLSQKYKNLGPAEIEFGEIILEEDKYTTRKFSFNFDPTLSGGPNKKVTGVVNIPKGTGPFPLVILFRGYVDQTIYTPGTGTKRVGEFFAENGFITLAPDFLGYAGSDTEATNIFESRFQTYTTAITLLKAASNIKYIPVMGSEDTKLDNTKIFIWAHSNGGQIALTALEITGLSYPTSLWAPNSAKFPYSIIYYLDEAEDSGKLLITELSKFMADYDVSKYAFSSYLDKIKAPIQINQGTGDGAIPVRWSDSLAKKLEDNKVSTKYLKYPGADHNMNPMWQNAIEASLTFFNTNFEVQ